MDVVEFLKHLIFVADEQQAAAAGPFFDERDDLSRGFRIQRAGGLEEAFLEMIDGEGE